MRFSALFFAYYFGIAILAFEGNAKAAGKLLDLAKIKHSQIALESSLYGIFREGTTVMTFPGENNFYMRSVYNPEAKEVDLGFGSLHNPYDASERINFEPKETPRRVRSVLHNGNHWAFLDVMSRQFLVWNDSFKAWQAPADLILDLAKPARDSRGEPTRAEIAALRARLTKTLTKEKLNPDLIAGITAIPKTWKDRDGSQYVLWLRVGMSPLLTVKCDLTNFKVCQVQRACFVSGFNQEGIEGINSISLNPAKQTLLLLNRSKGRIFELSGNSCHSLKGVEAYQLPKSLENTQSIFVDETNNLWLALREAEGASSASLFTWDAKSW